MKNKLTTLSEDIERILKENERGKIIKIKGAIAILDKEIPIKQRLFGHTKNT